MKNTTLIIVTAAILLAGSIITSCQSSAEKVEDAKVNVQDANKDLKDAQKNVSEEAQKAAKAKEWEAFKSESETKIRNNETLTAELKEKMKTSGKKLDKVYADNIAKLEQKNQDLKSRMDAYEKGQTDWQSFKREFNHDMDELGNALKDLTVNNKN